MKIVYQREGGVASFPGLSAAISVDTAELTTAQADRLARLCADARLLDRPPPPTPSPHAADAYRYTLSVTQGRRRRTLQLQDPVEDQGLQALLDFLEGLRGAG
jgi:hypothetical protein